MQLGFIIFPEILAYILAVLIHLYAALCRQGALGKCENFVGVFGQYIPMRCRLLDHIKEHALPACEVCL